ncbi:MAG: lipid A biosynthesis acyltransferase [Candidatus Obscuribacterales bacterium]|nr:lipid A biosynthesis acyltransferase [Steroidobacteraceae bacterium]
MSRDWRSHEERSTPLMLQVIVWLATRLRRSLVRPLLYPIVAYFFLTSPISRAASAGYLRRVFSRQPQWRDHWRHFFAFASCTLDRIFMLTERFHDLDIEVHRSVEVQALVARQPGCLLFVAHFGLAETLRVMGTTQRGLPLSILLDREHGRMLTQLLEQLNPTLAQNVIDASKRGPQLVLALKEALQSGRMIGIMADRALLTDRAVTVDFLGAPARVPVGPWQLAGVLQVPVILGFGCYLGGNRYSVHLELFSESIHLPRERREAAIAEWAQRYARRLEHYARLAPYNWFNFYDYWLAEQNAESDRADDAAAHQ